ncbi:GNAT family N-acetyltransferase [Enterococcus sp. LJL98]
MILETARLVLRRFQLKDLSQLHFYRNDPLCARYQEWEDTTLDELHLFIQRNQTRSLKDQQIQVAIATKEDDQLIGDLFVAKKGRTITLGFTTSPEFQRQGYMFEALSTFLPYLQTKYPQAEILCLVHPGNLASERLLAKLHFEKERYLAAFHSNVFILKKKPDTKR